MLAPANCRRGRGHPPGAKRRPVGVHPRRPQKFCQTFSGFWITRPLSFPKADENKIQVAQKYNFQRYHCQGIGRYEPSDVVQARPCRFTDLSTTDFSSIRSRPARASMGFVANIYFYKIDTPLRKFFASHTNLIRHCNAVHTHVIKN